MFVPFTGYQSNKESDRSDGKPSYWRRYYSGTTPIAPNLIAGPDTVNGRMVKYWTERASINATHMSQVGLLQFQGPDKWASGFRNAGIFPFPFPQQGDSVTGRIGQEIVVLSIEVKIKAHFGVQMHPYTIDVILDRNSGSVIPEYADIYDIPGGFNESSSLGFKTENDRFLVLASKDFDANSALIQGKGAGLGGIAHLVSQISNAVSDINVEEAYETSIVLNDLAVPITFADGALVTGNEMLQNRFLVVVRSANNTVASYDALSFNLLVKYIE